MITPFSVRSFCRKTGCFIANGKMEFVQILVKYCKTLLDKRTITLYYIGIAQYQNYWNEYEVYNCGKQKESAGYWRYWR